MGNPTKQGFWVSIYAHTRIKIEHEPLLIHTLKNFTSHAYIASHALYISIHILHTLHLFLPLFFRSVLPGENVWFSFWNFHLRFGFCKKIMKWLLRCTLALIANAITCWIIMVSKQYWLAWKSCLTKIAWKRKNRMRPGHGAESGDGMRTELSRHRGEGSNTPFHSRAPRGCLGLSDVTFLPFILSFCASTVGCAPRIVTCRKRGQCLCKGGGGTFYYLTTTPGTGGCHLTTLTRQRTFGMFARWIVIKLRSNNDFL